VPFANPGHQLPPFPSLFYAKQKKNSTREKKEEETRVSLPLFVCLFFPRTGSVLSPLSQLFPSISCSLAILDDYPTCDLDRNSDPVIIGVDRREVEKRKEGRIGSLGVCHHARCSCPR
jgi:hypothetical protein